MAMTFTTTATREGARDVNRASRATMQEDLGGKLQALISQVNLLMSAAILTNASGVTFSGLSGVTISSISNFRD